jgi:hypothetical protein
MWHTVRNALIVVAILAFLVWSGLLWAFFAAIPWWTYLLVGASAVAVTAFTRWAWKQNMVSSFDSPIVYAPRELKAGEDIVDAKIVED